MRNEKRSPGFAVDEHGEIFQADLTDEGDEFVRTQKVRKVTRGSIEGDRALPQSFVGVLGSLPKDAIRSLENARIDE